MPKGSAATKVTPGTWPPLEGGSSKLKLQWGRFSWMLVEICWDLGSVNFSP